MKPDRIQIAVVGCGAIAELSHLPAAAISDNVRVSLLVDADKNRASQMANQFGIPHFSTRVEDVAKHATAAIVAVPHHLHASISNELLASGIHVLIEKPLAVDLDECDSMIAAAESGQAILAVAMPRRFCASFRFLKKAIESQLLGKIHRFEIENGSAEKWPSRSLYLLRKAESGGGVLMANGCHDLDFAFALFGELTEMTSEIDSKIGLEANAKLDLKMQSVVTGAIEVSRTRNLKNQIRIEGERGVLEAPLIGNEAKLTLNGQVEKVSLSGNLNQSDNPFLEAVKNQLDNFANAIRGQEPVAADAQSGKKVVEWIHRCHESAQLIQHPWSLPITLPT